MFLILSRQHHCLLHPGLSEQRRFDFAAASFGRGQGQNRAEPLSAGEEAVTHRLVNGGGPGVFFRQITIKNAVDQFLA